MDYFLSIDIFCTCKAKKIFNFALRQKQKSRITTFIAILPFTVTTWSSIMSKTLYLYPKMRSRHTIVVYMLYGLISRRNTLLTFFSLDVQFSDTYLCFRISLISNTKISINHFFFWWKLAIFKFILINSQNSTFFHWKTCEMEENVAIDVNLIRYIHV